MVDPTLYERTEDDDGVVTFALPEGFLEQHLVSFLEKQYAVMQVEASEAESALVEIREAISRDQLQELADERSLRYFSAGEPQGSFRVGPFLQDRVRYAADTLDYFHAGKIFLEEHGLLFAYLQNMIRAQSDQYPLAGAACAYIM